MNNSKSMKGKQAKPIEYLSMHLGTWIIPKVWKENNLSPFIIRACIKEHK